MASGSIEKSFHTGFKIIVDWSSTATASSNSSVITAVVKMYCPYAIQISGRNGNTVVINGVTYTFNSSAVSTSGGTTHTLGTVTSNAITHNSDGTKSVTITANFQVNASLSGTYYGTQTASGTAKLDAISRASTLTCAGGYIGDTVAIVINKASSNYTHTVFWQYGSGTGSIATSTTANRLTWTIDDAIGTAMGTAKSAKVTLGCYTYNGSTKVGETYLTITVQKNTTAKPTVTASVTDINTDSTALTGNTKLVKYISTAKVTVTATAQNGANIESIVVKNAGVTKSGATTLFTGVSHETFYITVKDSYGNIVSVTKTVSMLDYTKLTCYIDDESITAAGDATITIKGNYFNGSFGNAYNTLSVKYRYKSSDGEYSGWYTATTTKSSNTYTAIATISGLDYKESYTFEAMATDKLMTVYSNENAASALPVFDWGKEDFNFNVPVNVNGSIETDGCFIGDADGYEAISTQDNGDLRIGYGGYAETSSDLLLYGSDIDCTVSGDFWINGVSVSSALATPATAGTWTPTCNVISTYTQRYGTWMKIGDACTISFCIVGTANSSKDTVTITGLPFTPDANHKWQAGGGNFANGLTTANNVFSGWTIENGDATIYARSTAWASTATTRASAYVGSTSGQTLYMSGTIMYRVQSE